MQFSSHMRSHSTGTNSGFTLLEFLLYIAIIGVTVVAAGAILFNILFAKAKLSALDEVNHNGRFAMEKIADAVRNAEAINAPAPQAASGSLSLQMADGSLDPTVFSLSGGAMTIAEGVGAPAAITTGDVTVSDAVFTNVSYAGTPGTVRIRMTIASVNPDNRPEFAAQETFIMTVNVREQP